MLLICPICLIMQTVSIRIYRRGTFRVLLICPICLMVRIISTVIYRRGTFKRVIVDMSYMFSYASTFNTSLSTWDVLSVVDMKYMFSGASKFNSDVSRWRGVAASNPQSGMFDNAYAVHI